ncbi:MULTISPECIES: RHS repeat domain-containing protein [Pseudomonas syringae group]|uniref:Teneurin-like YD-shell domain-containing protein n=1 Tax=Pseudomonas syringae group genomosp. 3 TaxID=251701 RepID=A0A2K4W682_9PSED|nr:MULTISPECIES: RHS repeat-associated core domain-containing protein [Pseudomonas syringae group]EGH10541.1 hypothetical protein PSYMP_13949 [Pseudomonas amygdali pv. morsprunorum str. M302280]SOS31408.1 hypothetical protein CFBP6411_00038 [Pseudomonas syringae group genomosp. 3]SPF10112.1 hypothetical protein PSCFBP3800_00040 [Pseudomonas syringae group genomosp. 3]
MQFIKRLFRKVSVAMLGLMVTHAALANNVTYFHNDISGSPMVATDATGNLLWKESYKPYGEKLNQTSPVSSNKIGFHGKVFDDNTGLSYMGARYYDPLLGRFMGADPVDFQEGNLHSFNRYAYANNNPQKYVDPDGEYAFLIAPAFYALTALTGAAAITSALKSGGLAKDDGFDSNVMAYPVSSNSPIPWSIGQVQSESTESGYGTNEADQAQGENTNKDSKKKVRDKDVPYEGKPGEVKEGIRRTREYGADGTPMRDYDKPHQGHNTPHVHEWPGGVREHPGRNYSPLPRN